MVIKTRDPMDAALHDLHKLRKTCGLWSQQIARIDDEISRVKSGDRGEREAAYIIDSEIASSRDYAVVHDLRIEHEGRVAQIDHLLMGCTLDFILIESRSNGAAIRLNGTRESEIKASAQVLSGFLKSSGLLPYRLGFQVAPEFHHWILVPANSPVLAGRGGTEVIGMDGFGVRMVEWRERSALIEMSKAAKTISSETLHSFAAALAARHRPIATVNYEAKLGLSSAPRLTGELVVARPPLAATSEPSGRIEPAKVNDKVVAFRRFDSE